MADLQPRVAPSDAEVSINPQVDKVAVTFMLWAISLAEAAVCHPTP